MNEEIFIPIVLFLSTAGVLYIYLIMRNKERMALIEKGQSAELFNKPNKEGNWALKVGIVSIGVAIGILLGNILDKMSFVNDDVSYPSMIFLFGGIGLIVSHYMTRKKN